MASPYEPGGVQHATINDHRFHLVPGKQNRLWVDGQQLLLLDDTRTFLVEAIIEAMWKFQQGDGDESAKVIDYVVSKMLDKYGARWRGAKKAINKKRIRADLHRVFAIMMDVAEGACPSVMGLPALEVEYSHWEAPARADLALTYGCNESCGKCYLDDSALAELDTIAWEAVLDKLWSIGIPQVVFTGGEPTLRADLAHLVDHAKLFVTGLVTNGTYLADLAASLVEASLDYAQVTIESWRPAVHDQMTCTSGSHYQTAKGIAVGLSAGLQIVTNTTLTSLNANDFCDTIQWLASLGVEHVACNTLICSGSGTAYKAKNGIPDNELLPILESALVVADKVGVDLQWYSPTCYNAGINPLLLGFGPRNCSAAAYNLTIRPDGSVIPCQSWPDSIGHILTDDWNAIWHHPLADKLRNRGFAPKECHDCGSYFFCNGGCPLDKSTRICN